MTEFEMIAERMKPQHLRMNDGESAQPLTQTEKIELLNSVEASEGTLPVSLLKEVDCPICKNKGYIVTKEEHSMITSKECECMNRRRAYRRIHKSGLDRLLREYTFPKYSDEEDWQKVIKSTALQYAKANSGDWFYISGTPGTGKSHICTAIIFLMISKYSRDCIFMSWREEAPNLKALVNEREQYEEKMNLYKNVDVLYIDDFFKGKEVSSADINLAFELLNYRYNNRLATIISSERSIVDILDLDEALGSRIHERSKNYQLRTKSGANWRLK